MLQILVPTSDDVGWDEEAEEFVPMDTFVLEMEHSLVSLSKWEAHFEKPFIGTEKSVDEILWYIQAMTLTPEVPKVIFSRLTKQNYEEINAYIEAKMTATWFSEEKNQRGPRETITSEVIYYWMIAHNIPFSCEEWHLNRLITLVQVCNRMNAPKKKMTREEIIQRNRALNAQRRAQMGTTG